MPAEAAPLAQSNPSIAPKKKSAPVGKAALAKVTLLDGSVLDVTIDVILIFAIKNSIVNCLTKKNVFCLAQSKRSRFIEFNLCWIKYCRKGLFRFVVFNRIRSKSLVRIRETGFEIFKN
jgi:hypothetical protein